MLHRLRRDVEFITVLAAQAGITCSEYRAVEEGRLPCSRALYDVVVARFPQLSVYPPPPPDPPPLLPTMHSAVAHEYQRIQPILNLIKQMKHGSTNRTLVADFGMMCIRGEVTADDIQRLLRMP